MTKCKNIEVIDDVYYYYVKPEKKVTGNDISSLVSSIYGIIDILNDSFIDKIHYSIVYNFIIGFILVYRNFDECINAFNSMYKKYDHKEKNINLYFCEVYKNIDNIINDLTKLKDDLSKQNEELTKQNEELSKQNKQNKELVNIGKRYIQKLRNPR
jgi:hypothetical protein